MTRNEAIEWNKNLKMYMKLSDRIHPCKFLEDNYIALDMAIQALEQDPCEIMISRQAVMDCFKKWQPYMATKMWEFEKELSALPSVTPELKTGHWIDITNKHGTVIAVRCSCCGQSPKHAIKSDYCPSCGAKLRYGNE